MSREPVNDWNFHELGSERDSIIGTRAGTLEFKIPKRPIRRKITGLPAFTTVRGGAYFFYQDLRHCAGSQTAVKPADSRAGRPP